MRWQIAHFIFCDQQQSLVDEKQTLQLEPMAVELLRYFCQHPDVIISKDELITNVWLGRVVSDNTVSKLITKLRKAFADNPRQPQFIATFPKKGYKFIATVTRVDEQQTTRETTPQPTDNILEDSLPRVMQTNPPVVNHSDSEVNHAELLPNSLIEKPKRQLIIMLLMIAFILMTYLIWPVNNEARITTSAQALTTDAGDELFPEFSPDGTRVAYLSNIQGNVYLRIKRIADEKVITIDDHGDIGVGPASWNDDGTKLAYLVGNSNQCQYFIREISGLTLGKPTLIHNCTAGSFGKILFTHDDKRLVYAENNGIATPYALFSIHSETGEQRRVAQPDIYLGGNSQFDLHPTENKLLISSPDQQQWEGFYQLDIERDKLTFLFKLNAYVCCAIWSHDGNHVVMMGEHPAYELIRYRLTGKKEGVIYSGTRVIRAPRRHINGQDYLFSAGNKNIDIALLALDTKQQVMIADSSVNEQFSRFSHHSNQVAYISLATGHEEVWLTDLNRLTRRKLTHFNDDRHYLDLRWSPDDRYLMALTLNEIHLISLEDGTFIRLKIPQNEIRGVSFKRNSVIAYSVKVDERWQVHFYDLKTDSVSKAERRWQYVHFSDKEQNTLWLDQQHQLFVGNMNKELVNNLELANYVMNGRQFNLRKRGLYWYWFDSNRQEILSLLSENDSIQPLVKTRISDFDIAEGQLSYSQANQNNVDIYQTYKATK
ncbi:winged helix-turn-helix domain-containing protein [Thalassotalea hakodatensis]|uniref:winged helix-turn-helix domain-containing protein n=1 Tax=Thalassotalea hakodatensis TaxID=3030492 RepID=UPI00257357CD|nr:winged helix-turn-helix domain-containing protein [Thalassotalea hakodatensis]